MNLFEVEDLGLISGFLVALICSIAVVITVKWHGKFTLDGTTGVQKNHASPRPRVGGAAILAGFIGTYLAANGSMRALFGPILVAALPAFIFGFVEDLTKKVSVRARLLATMASGVLAWSLTGISITHVGVWGLDSALVWLPFSVLFTSFAVGGVANAVNIIDGFHGLASGTVAICVVALGVIAHNAGDAEFARLCFCICAVIIGFLVVNFPLGKLFLGDGGAYMLGFVMAWLAVMLPARNPSVSVWASFLACGYPIFETSFTIARRMWSRTHPGLADSGHLHSLIKIGISNRLVPARSQFSNALVSPFSWTIAALAAALAVKNAGNTMALMVSAVASFLLYLTVYCYVAAAARSATAASARPALSVVPTRPGSIPIRGRKGPSSDELALSMAPKANDAVFAEMAGTEKDAEQRRVANGEHQWFRPAAANGLRSKTVAGELAVNPIRH